MVKKPDYLAPCHRSERYIVAVETASHRSKLFQIMFHKKDGSLFVNFPYFEHSKGLVSMITWTPNIPPPASLSLEPGGKVTSHLVKYSHHPDGRAHFSQDGKIFTAIKKQSVPIKNIQGHVFTVQLQGLASFEALEPEHHIAVPSLKRITLKFSFGDEEPEAVKFVARWYSQGMIIRSLKEGRIGPLMTLSNPGGKPYRAFMCSAPPGHAAQNRILALSCEGIPRLDQNEESALTFIGGFDKREIADDLTKTTSFLALSYPINDTDELASRIGSVDFIPKATQ